MSDPTAEFFDALGRRRHERILEQAAGTVRFDLTGERETEHWFLEISHGDLSVSRDAGPADCVIRVDHGVFDKITTGETNFWAAWLRYEVVFEGNTVLATFFLLILPGPPGSHDPRRNRGNAAEQR